MNQRDKDIAWIKGFLGESFKSGKKIVNGKYSRYAVIELKDGREIKLSIPNNEIKGYTLTQ